MPKVNSFFQGPGFAGKRFAALLHNKMLYYHANAAIDAVPPSVFVWSHAKTNKLGTYKDVMTSYGKDWTHTYSNKARPTAQDNPGFWNADYDGATLVTKLEAALWDDFGFVGLGAPPELEGLYADETSHGVSRARRVYLLAAFAKMKKYGLKNKAGGDGHNIGSILTSDSGEVLSWGMNTGGFCHAEVNTVLGYLARNDAKRLPEKSVLFTTLKPCLMCSRLISEAQNSGSKVRAWYGMVDTGEKGNTGLLGDYSAPFSLQNKVVTNLDVADFEEVKEPLVQGTKPVNVGTKETKEALTDKLDLDERQRVANPKKPISAADWVDQSPEVLRLVAAAATKFKGKADKPERDDGAMKKVLGYLKDWAL